MESPKDRPRIKPTAKVRAKINISRIFVFAACSLTVHTLRDSHVRISSVIIIHVSVPQGSSQSALGGSPFLFFQFGAGGTENEVVGTD